MTLTTLVLTALVSRQGRRLLIPVSRTIYHIFAFDFIYILYIIAVSNLQEDQCFVSKFKIKNTILRKLSPWPPKNITFNYTSLFHFCSLILFWNIPAAAEEVAGEDALRLRPTGAEQLIVWQILNSTHRLLDIFYWRAPTWEHLLLEQQRFMTNPQHLKVSAPPQLFILSGCVLCIAVTQATLQSG